MILRCSLQSLEGKSEVFRELVRLLNPGGALLLADAFLLPGETREQYGERFTVRSAGYANQELHAVCMLKRTSGEKQNLKRFCKIFYLWWF